MGYEAVLILLFSFTFAVLFWSLVRRGEDLFAVLITFLFIYTVFTQIGYAYYPDIAARMQVYFGRDLFVDYWVFVYLSFVATVGARRLFVRRRVVTRNNNNYVEPAPLFRFRPFIFMFVALLYEILLGITFIVTYEGIQYADISSVWLAYLINMQPLFVMVLYIKSRIAPSGPSRLFVRVVTAAAAALFLFISFRAGQRLNGLTLLVGIAFFELSPFRLISRRKLVRLVGVGVAATLFLMAADRVVALRDSYQGAPPLEAILFDQQAERSSRDVGLERFVALDYFAPSSLIFASMHYGWIMPAEVTKSNVMNALVFMDYPYLSSTVSSMVTATSFSRMTSYGYYIFTEGFNFAGWWGILYNCIVINLCFRLWEVFTSSRSMRFNRCMAAIVALQIVASVRAQSVIFVKASYLGIVPGMVLVALACNYWPRWSARASSKRGNTWAASRTPVNG